MVRIKGWQHETGASQAALDRLRQELDVPLPDAYLSFLRRSNGGQGPLNVQPFWLCLHSAETVVDIRKKNVFGDFFPGLLVIGSNGGGDAIAFDLNRSRPQPVVYFDMINADLDESVRPLAPSFEALLKLIGDADD